MSFYYRVVILTVVIVLWSISVMSKTELPIQDSLLLWLMIFLYMAGDGTDRED